MINVGTAVRATGTGNVNITATGGGGGAGNSNIGLYLITSSAISAAGGDINITGNAGDGSGGSVDGIHIAGATISNTGTGDITLTGTGGGTGVGSQGVMNQGTISVADGTATITGAGSATGSGSNVGVSTSGAGNKIRATGSGNVSVTGTGRGTNTSNIGVQIHSGGVFSTVDGTLTVNGQGSTTGTDANHGVYVLSANSAIQATGAGTVSVTGSGGGSGAGNSNYGVAMITNAAISGVNGNIAITGTGGGGTVGVNRGILMSSTSVVGSTGAGAITLTGTGGSGPSSEDIVVVTGSNVIGGGSDTGAITLIGDTMNLANFSAQTTGNVTLKPRTASTTIGVAGGAGTLGVTSAILNSITAGSITLGRSDGTGAMTANAYTWNSDATLMTGATGGITVNGAHAMGVNDLTLQADSDIALNANLSGTGALTVKPSSVGTTIGLGGGAGTLNLSSADLTRLVDGWSSITIGRSDGTGAITVNGATWTDPLNLFTGTGGIALNGAQAMGGNAFLARSYGASDITIGASGSVTSSAANTAITLASGRNFINSAGSGALSAPSGRWLVYSTNPASDTIGSLSNAFRRFTCAYGGACPAFPAAGNGLLYSYTPTLTATPAVSITYGDAAPNLNGYAYTLSGYLGSDSGSDSVTGTLVGTTTYAQGNNAGTYNITYGSGTLTSPLGYAFSYASSATALTVNKKTLTATADDKSRVHGSPNPPLTVSYAGFYGADTSAALDTAPTASTTATQASTAGVYAITAAGGVDNNYDFTYVDGVLTVVPEHGRGGPDVISDDTGAGGVDPGTGGEPVTGPPADPVLPGTATPTPSTARVTLPSPVIRGAQELTDNRRMDGDTGLWDSFSEYMAAEREDDPFAAATPASEDASTDDAPISILGGLVQIAPKLARVLGLDVGL